MALSQDEGPKIPGRIRVAPEHLKLWNVKESIGNTLIAVPSTYLSVLFLNFLALGSQIPITEIGFSRAQFAAFTGAGFVLLVFLSRNRTIETITLGFDFSKIYYYHALGVAFRWIRNIGIAAVFALFLIVVIYPNWMSIASLLVSFAFTYLAAPVASYFNIFDVEVLASLCLTQALDQNRDVYPWVQRGLTAAAGRLNDLLIHTYPRKLLFAFNLKLLKGEPVDNILGKLASGIVKICPSNNDNDRQICADLYETIRDLDREVDFAAAEGVIMAPSYSERITNILEMLTKSSQLISYILLVAVTLLIYLLTGRQLQLPPIP